MRGLAARRLMFKNLRIAPSSVPLWRMRQQGPTGLNLNQRQGSAAGRETPRGPLAARETAGF
jgi:hypothetical protein